MILACVLSALYWIILSQIEISAFKGEIENVVQTGVTNALTQYDTNGEIKTLIQQSNGPLTQLQAVYAQPDVRQTVNNQWLFVANCIVLTFIFVILILYYILVKYVARKDMKVWSIVKENIITFLLVGSFEAFFIMFYVTKNVPTLPSYITTYTVSEVKSLIVGTGTGTSS